MPGQALFAYEDDSGESRGIDSSDVNDYLREAGGADFSAKDFRTWHATVQALSLVARLDATQRGSRGAASSVLAEVAARLRNTVAVCRKSYVHPGVLALAEMAGDDPLLQRLAASPNRATTGRAGGLSVAENALLAFLKREEKAARRRVGACTSRCTVRTTRTGIAPGAGSP